MSRILRNLPPFFATVLVLAACGGDASDGGDAPPLEELSLVPEGNWSVPEGASTSDDVQEQLMAFLSDLEPSDEASVAGAGYYTLRSDRRRCAPAHCGGFFAKRVNGLSTVCADGSSTPQCYVAELDLSALRLAPEQVSAIENDPERFLLAGDIVSAGGAAGRLQVTEAWQAPAAVQYDGPYLRVKSSGTVCVSSPCPALAAELLNSRLRPVSIGEVNLTGLANANDAREQLNTNNGLLVAAGPGIMRGPGGRALGLYATNYYLPVVAQTTN